MAKERSGYVFQDSKKRWYARVTVTDATGQRRNVKRRAENKTIAKETLRQLLRELDDHGERTVDSAYMTFNDLSDYFEKNYVKAAEYVEGRKIAGVRSLATARGQLSALKEYFGKRRLRTITHGDIRSFKAARLKTPTRTGSQRAIASVNRELSMLRRMFNVALREGWILRSPFMMGDSLISIADEHQRERIITKEEEERLLAACSGRRAHIRPLVICALDTGMRHGEIIKLKWSDVDFENYTITVQGMNTKTLRERQVAMSTRLAHELLKVYERSTKAQDALVFGITDNVKKSFNSARLAASLPDVRFHDLRHTHATRLVAAHIPLPEVGRALGHTQANTTFRYVNANVETARRAAAAIDRFNESENQAVEPAVIN